MPLKKKSYLSARFKISGVVIVLLGFAMLFLSKAGPYINDNFLDLLFNLRGSQPESSEVVIVAIDEPSFANLQQQWPWPRGVHADLLHALQAEGAKAVAMDIIFSEPSVAAEDLAFMQAIAENGNVVLGTDVQTYRKKGFVQQINVQPLPLFADEGGATTGFVNMPVDQDGFVRQLKSSWNSLPPLSLQAVRRYLNDPSFFDGQDERMFINYIGPPQSVRTVSYYQALDPGQYLPPGFFKDKLVFVGLLVQSVVNAESKRPDYFPVPFSRQGGGYMSGIEIHSQAAISFLRANSIRQPFPRGLLWLSLLAAGLLSPLFFRLSTVRGGLLTAGWASTVFMVSYYLFDKHCLFVSAPSHILPLATCYGYSFLCNYFEQLRERIFIQNAFSSYLAPSVVNQLLKNPERLQLGGEEVLASVMFMDIAGYTSLSEKLSPTELIRFLNIILGKVSDTVFKTDGMVDKYIGDAVMAVWGVPLPYPEHAINACKAALLVVDAIQEQNSQEGFPARISVRIGVNSGHMVVGNVGGEHHLNYTVIGDTVNLSSRLEGINRYYGTRIIVSGETALLLNQEFVLRELDRVKVKGKEEAVTIFELQGLDGQVPGPQREVNEHFRQGLYCYRQMAWDEAEAMFRKGLAIVADDGPCLTFIERCQVLKESPPAPDWEGVFQHLKK